MAGIKKLKADPTHLNNFMSSDVHSGNNAAGPGTSVGTKYVDGWPTDPASDKDGGETKPAPNMTVPSRLTNNSNAINMGRN